VASFNAESLHEQTNFVLDRIVEASVVSIDATGQSYNRPRLTMPSDGQSGWIDIGQYFAMEDPVEAGRLLMIEAKKVGLNLDDSSRVWKETEPLYVRAGRIDSSEDTFEFMRRVRQEPRVVRREWARIWSGFVDFRQFESARKP